jgi:hypothetical protein
MEKEATGKAEILCPRCELNHYTPYGMEGEHPKPALSRADNHTHICSPCGTAEGMEDFLHGSVASKEEWPL